MDEKKYREMLQRGDNWSLGGMFGSAARGFFGLDPREGSDASNSEIHRIARMASDASGPAGFGAKIVGKGAQAVQAAPEMLSGLGLVIGPRAKGTSLFAELAAMKRKGHIEPDIEKWGRSQGAWKQKGVGWMTEIDDSAMKFNDENHHVQAFRKYGLANGNLGDILQHDELFKNYPHLAGFKVHMIRNRGDAKDNSGLFDPMGKFIRVYANDEEEAKKILVHELQHAIQSHEKWPAGGAADKMKTGTRAADQAKELERRLIEQKKQIDAQRANPSALSFTTLEDRLDMMKRTHREHKLWSELAKYPDTQKGREQAYQALWGERQADTTMDRLNMTADERKQFSFPVAMDSRAPTPAIMKDWSIFTNPYDPSDALKDTVFDTTR